MLDPLVKELVEELGETVALIYAEKHGVIEYHVRKGKMIYYTSFPMEHMTYKATVDLETLKETREPLRRYFVAYEGKIGGRYQANYCV